MAYHNSIRIGNRHSTESKLYTEQCKRYIHLSQVLKQWVASRPASLALSLSVTESLNAFSAEAELSDTGGFYIFSLLIQFFPVQKKKKKKYLSLCLTGTHITTAEIKPPEVPAQHSE